MNGIIKTGEMNMLSEVLNGMINLHMRNTYVSTDIPKEL